jgi:hypothetical protein
MSRTIYVSSGDVAYVNVTLAEKTNQDISGDTLQVTLQLASITTAPTTGWMTPTNVAGSQLALRTVKFLAGTGTTFTTPGTYTAWVRDSTAPEVQSIPCKNAQVTLV